MSAFGEWAGELRAAADRMSTGLALEVVREQARDFLAVERAITPKRTGKLAGSETIDAIEGGGAHATAVVSPHTVYAEFRENGGTIHAHGGLGRKGMRPHTLHWDGGGFPRHVTQQGSHYVERSEAAARGMMNGIADQVLERFLDF